MDPRSPSRVLTSQLPKCVIVFCWSLPFTGPPALALNVLNSISRWFLFVHFFFTIAVLRYLSLISSANTGCNMPPSLFLCKYINTIQHTAAMLSSLTTYLLISIVTWFGTAALNPPVTIAPTPCTIMNYDITIQSCRAERYRCILPRKGILLNVYGCKLYPLSLARAFKHSE